MRVIFTACFIFFCISSFALPYQMFEENGKVGIKDEVGNVLIPPSFEALGWSDGSFSVIGQVTGYRLHGKWGLINLKKELITQALYLSLVYSGGEYVVARKKLDAVLTKTGCINLRGVIMVPFIYDGINIHGLRAIVFNIQMARYQYGLTDLQNHVLIPVEFKNIYPLGSLRYAI